MSQELVLDKLPNGKIDHISKIIQDRIRIVRGGQVPGSQVASPVESEDPLSVLKMRLARGEISKEEYSELKKLLE